MTNYAKSMLETALLSARNLAINAQLGEKRVFNIIKSLGLEDVADKTLDASEKPEWLNGDNISEAISCFLAYGEGDSNSIIDLIEQIAQQKE